MTEPPDLAESLVSLLVPARTRDSVVGDLLEEYREQASRHGARAADAWYWRQTVGFLWSASAWCGVGIGTTLTARMMIDVLAPSNQLHDRALVTTLVAMAIFAAFGFRLGYATRRVPGAVIMAVAASAIATIGALAATLLAMGVASALVHPGADAWAGLYEGLDIPGPIIAVVGTALASLGASIGLLVTGWSGPRASIRT